MLTIFAKLLNGSCFPLILAAKQTLHELILACCIGFGKRGHIISDTFLPMMFLGLRKLGNICCGHKMFLNKIRNIFVARAGKRGNICVGNNVSATMCPRLPGPYDIHCFAAHFPETFLFVFIARSVNIVSNRHKKPSPKKFWAELIAACIDFPVVTL